MTDSLKSTQNILQFGYIDKRPFKSETAVPVGYDRENLG